MKNSITKVTTACFAESDTRVLTNCGWLFLGDIERLEREGRQVLYACHDTASESLIYRTGRIVLSAPPTHWVDFTQAGTRRLWDATSDAHGSMLVLPNMPANRVTIRTTPDHRIYVQPCTQNEQRYADRSPVALQCMTAQELAPGYKCNCASVAGRICPHGFSHYRMITGAVSGLHASANVIALSDQGRESPVAALGLSTADELDAFLELFGFWLGDGTMQYEANGGSVDGVAFCQRKDRDDKYVRCLIERLRLPQSQWRDNYNKKYRSHIYYITDRRWFSYFDTAFGAKYQGSARYNARQALVLQGMLGPRPSLSSTASPVTSRSAGVEVGGVAVYDSDEKWAEKYEEGRRVLVERGAKVAVDAVDRVVPMEEDDNASMGDDDEEPRLTKREFLSDGEDDDDDEEDDPVKSAKWLPEWALFRLTKPQLRLLIEGLRQADGRTAATAVQCQAAEAYNSAFAGERQIATSAIGFRDQLVQACVHAGYTAFFKLDTRAGSVRGYNAVPADGSIYTKEEMEAALQIDSTRHFTPVRSNHDSYLVCYGDEVSQWLPAQDVRFDGQDCTVVQQKRENKQGWVAVHCGSGEVKHAPTMRELGDMLSVSDAVVKQSVHKGTKVGSAWRCYSAAAYDEAQSGHPRQSPVFPTLQADLYDKERDGRVWCVQVDHPDHLIVVQRAHRGENGVVTKVGRSIIIGNCFEPALDYLVVKIPRWDMKKFNHVSDLIGSAMKSVGEVMAIGRTFEEAFQKAIRMVDGSLDGFGDTKSCLFSGVTNDVLDVRLREPSDERVMAIALAYQRGYSIQRVWELTKIDKCEHRTRTHTPICCCSVTASVADQRLDLLVVCLRASEQHTHINTYEHSLKSGQSQNADPRSIPHRFQADIAPVWESVIASRGACAYAVVRAAQCMFWVVHSGTRIHRHRNRLTPHSIASAMCVCAGF